MIVRFVTTNYFSKRREGGPWRAQHRLDRREIPPARLGARIRDRAFLHFAYEEIVGAAVGKQLQNQASLAVLYSLAGMLIYLWFRFELIYGVAAALLATSPGKTSLSGSCPFSSIASKLEWRPKAWAWETSARRRLRSCTPTSCLPILPPRRPSSPRQPRGQRPEIRRRGKARGYRRAREGRAAR